VPIEWTSDLATGIESIDAEHRELYAQVAALHAAMRSGRLGEVTGIMDFLQRYATQHFANEEATMAAAGYPGAGEHEQHHQAFVKDFLAMRAGLESNGITASRVIDLSTWLGQWLRQHVRGVDLELARYLRRVRP
jgi:hemerythrin